MADVKMADVKMAAQVCSLKPICSKDFVLSQEVLTNSIEVNQPEDAKFEGKGNLIHKLVE